jgi:putative membrane protein
MVLPGISGSTLLLVFGLYLPIMTSIKELLTFNFNKLPILIVFGLGVVIGIVFFVKLIRNCLSKHRSKMIYFIIGMMLGSIYSIIMGPTTLDNPVSPLSIKTFNILFFILGCIIIFGLELFKKYASKK